MELDFFMDRIAQALEEDARAAYPSGTKMQDLPARWAARLNSQANGIRATIQSDGVLLVQSPDNRWQLYLIVPPQTPPASK